MMDWKMLMSPQRLGDTNAVKLDADPLRSAFERDYDRIIFSRPFRNLQEKTQVFPLPDQDFVHTRLTHSLEVSSVGRSLGKNVGSQLLKKYTDLHPLTANDFGAVVGAAALAHDVGNPAFGHSGETAISDYFKHNPEGEKIKKVVTESQWQDLIRFEGNAQGFRLLTRNQRQGLKLTMATLAAFTKYPCPSDLENRNKQRKSQKKYGYFQSEHSTFQQMAECLGLHALGDGVWSRHPLTFLVEAADDICYNIIDLEDAYGLGLVTFEQVRDFLKEILQQRFQPEKLEKIPSDLEKIGVLRAVAIQKLIEECTEVFMTNEIDILKGQYDHALTDHIPSANVMNEVKKFSINKIYQSRLVLEKEVAGFEVMDGLLNAFVQSVFTKYYDQDNFSGKAKSIFSLLPKDVIYKLDNESSTPYESVLTITDYISSLTDSTALNQYRILKGINLQGGSVML